MAGDGSESLLGSHPPHPTSSIEYNAVVVVSGRLWFRRYETEQN